MKDPNKGVNRTTKRHHGTAEQQHWQPKKTIPELPNATQLGQQKQEAQQKTRGDCGTRSPKGAKDQVTSGN